MQIFGAVPLDSGTFNNSKTFFSIYLLVTERERERERENVKCDMLNIFVVCSSMQAHYDEFGGH